MFKSVVLLFLHVLLVLYLDKGQRGIVNAASSALWPNNVVPYVLEAAFTTSDRAIIAAVSTCYLGSQPFYIIVATI
jgi:hypothetical protein